MINRDGVADMPDGPRVWYPASRVYRWRLRFGTVFGAALASAPMLGLIILVWYVVGRRAAAWVVIVQVVLVLVSMLATLRAGRAWLATPGMRLIGPQRDRALYLQVAHMASRAGVRCPATYVLDSGEYNAWATWLGPRRPVLVVCSVWVDRPMPDQLAGLLAHELAHIVSRDILLVSWVRSWNQVLSMANRAGVRVVSRSKPVRKSIRHKIGRVVSGVLLGVVPAYVGWLLGFCLRMRESAADLSAAAICGSPGPILACLAALPPSAAGSKGYSHPATQVRRAAIKRVCAKQMARLPLPSLV